MAVSSKDIEKLWKEYSEDVAGSRGTFCEGRVIV